MIARQGMHPAPIFKGDPIPASLLEYLRRAAIRSTGGPGTFYSSALQLQHRMKGGRGGSTTSTVTTPGEFGISQGQVSVFAPGVDNIYKILECPIDIDPGDLIGEHLYAPAYSLHNRPYNVGLGSGSRVILFGTVTWMDSETFDEWVAALEGTFTSDSDPSDIDGDEITGGIAKGMLCNVQDYLRECEGYGNEKIPYITDTGALKLGAAGCITPPEES